MSARDNPQLREIVERDVLRPAKREEFAYAVLDEVLGPLREPRLNFGETCPCECCMKRKAHEALCRELLR